MGGIARGDGADQMGGVPLAGLQHLGAGEKAEAAGDQAWNPGVEGDQGGVERIAPGFGADRRRRTVARASWPAIHREPSQAPIHAVAATARSGERFPRRSHVAPAQIIAAKVSGNPPPWPDLQTRRLP